MTNNSSAYVIDSASGGDIQGSGSWSKWGSQALQIDGTTTAGVQLNEGSLSGSGSIGSATVAAGTTMNFSGSVGNGVSCAGVATLAGSSSGTLTIQANGIVTNSGTYSGPITTTAGALLVNNGTFVNAGNSTVVTNATLINNGPYHGLTLTIGGTLKDLGNGGIYMNGDVLNGTRGLTINGGATFIPGGDGIGTTFPGRVLFSLTSTNIFKVDPGAPANTVLDSAFLGLGPNQNTKAFNGGTIVISNTTLTPFAAGQSFTLFGVYPGGGTLLDAGTNTANSYPIIVPETPGPGLAWDLSGLLPADGGGHGSGIGGVIGVRGVATTPTNVHVSSTFTTVVGTNNIATNIIVSELSWPTNYIGWKLQQQINPVNICLSTNWTVLVDATFTNDIVLTNLLTTNCIFYRMVAP